MDLSDISDFVARSNSPARPPTRDSAREPGSPDDLRLDDDALFGSISDLSAAIDSEVGGAAGRGGSATAPGRDSMLDGVSDAFFRTASDHGRNDPRADSEDTSLTLDESAFLGASAPASSGGSATDSDPLEIVDFPSGFFERASSVANVESELEAAQQPARAERGSDSGRTDCFETGEAGRAPDQLDSARLSAKRRSASVSCEGRVVVPRKTAAIRRPTADGSTTAEPGARVAAGSRTSASASGMITLPPPERPATTSGSGVIALPPTERPATTSGSGMIALPPTERPATTSGSGVIAQPPPERPATRSGSGAIVLPPPACSTKTSSSGAIVLPPPTAEVGPPTRDSRRHDRVQPAPARPSTRDSETAQTNMVFEDELVPATPISADAPHLLPAAADTTQLSPPVPASSTASLPDVSADAAATEQPALARIQPEKRFRRVPAGSEE